MKFLLGDNVIFKLNNLKGKIISINSDHRVTVLTEDGFEMDVSSKDIVKIENSELVMKSYGENFPVKDVDSKVEKKIYKKIKNKDDRSILKIDLHTESLNIGNNLLNHEILFYQIEECHKAINTALNSNTIKKLEIVHGIGNGRLKEEVHSILNDYNLRYYLTNNGGCTEVFI